MSVYDDCFFACALKPDTPQEVIDTLRYMTREADYDFTNPPAHNFFHIEPDWRDFLHDMYDHHVAPGLIASKLERKTHDFVAKPSIDYYEISFRRSLHDDVEFPMWFEFLDWIAPYSDTEGFVGYFREEYTLNPSLIYFKDGQLFIYNVDALPEEIYRDR